MKHRNYNIFMHPDNRLKTKDAVNKTHIIALTPMQGDIEPLGDVDKALLKAGLALNDWPHLTLAQYSNPFITPQICHGLQSIAANTRSISLTVTTIQYWNTSKVIYLRLSKTPKLVELYSEIQNIFLQFLPRLYVQRWYDLPLFWIPHITLAYQVQRMQFLQIKHELPTKKFELLFNTITLRDPEIRYKEFKLMS